MFVKAVLAAAQACPIRHVNITLVWHDRQDQPEIDALPALTEYCLRPVHDLLQATKSCQRSRRR